MQKTIFSTLIIFLLISMGSTAQKSRIYHEIYGLSVCNVHLKGLSQEQKGALDSLTAATVDQLRPLKQKLQNYDLLRNLRELEGLNPTQILDSIGRVESLIAEVTRSPPGSPWPWQP